MFLTASINTTQSVRPYNQSISISPRPSATTNGHNRIKMPHRQSTLTQPHITILLLTMLLHDCVCLGALNYFSITIAFFSSRTSNLKNIRCEYLIRDCASEWGVFLFTRNINNRHMHSAHTFNVFRSVYQYNIFHGIIRRI